MGPPPMRDGMPGRPPFGGKPPEEMRDLMKLMEWKRDHKSDPAVKKFDKSHPEPSRPKPGKMPDPSHFKAMTAYVKDLKKFKKEYEAEKTSSKKKKKPVKKDDEDPCSSNDSAQEFQEKMDKMQAQISRLKKKIKASKEKPAFPGKKRRPPFEEDPEAKARIQKRLVSQEVSKIQDRIQIAKDQITEFQDKECMPMGDMPFGPPPEGGRPGPGGPEFAMDDFHDFGPPDFDPPPFPGRPGPDSGMLMLDLPSDLQRQLDKANQELRQAQSQVRIARSTWQRKCQKENQAKFKQMRREGMPPTMNGGMPSTMPPTMSPMMGGSMNMMGGMSPIMMGRMGGMPPMMMGGGMNMMGGMPPMMMNGGMRLY